MKELVEIALSQYGVKEIAGEKDNQTIVDYFKDIGHKWVKDDETAWCSAFANWVALKAGCEYSGKLNARSWLNIGQEVTEPQLGDVVVFWRDKPSSWKGHVAYFISYSEDKKYIYCLGGNQGNMVCIKAYDASRLLGFRRLNKVA